MMKQKISEIMSNIDEEYICEATDYVRVKSRRFLNWIKGKVWILGLAVLIVLGGKFFPVLLNGKLFEKEPEKLVICTDYRSYDAVESAIKSWKVFGAEYSTIPVEVIRIPQDEHTAEIKITEIRTEIMAGQTEEGQLLLPLAYEYYACIFPENESGQNNSFPNSWEEICSSSSLGEALRNQNMRSFLVSLGLLADYKNETMLVSEDDLLNLYRSFALGQRKWDNSVIFTCVSKFEFLDMHLATRDNKTHTFYPIPNTDGGVTANISVYAGINRNTKMEEEAFSLLDYFYKFAKENDQFEGNGLFIEQDEAFLKEYKLKGVSQADISAFLEMNRNITTVRFYSKWDYALWDEFLAQGGRDSKPLEQVVKELYQTMQMQIKE